MAWRDQLLPASFRGVPFKVEEHEHAGGRRLAIHQYPGRDLPYPEDLGRDVRQFTISGYVLGSDYMRVRDALRDALEAVGAADLVHPYLGSKSVVVKAFSLRESTAEGGMARFSMTFVEAGKLVNPTTSVDRIATVGNAADFFSDAARADFLDWLKVDSVPEFVRDVVKGEVGQVTDIMDKFDFPQADSDLILAFRNKISAIKGAIDDLVNTPESLADSIKDIIGSISGVFGISSTSASTTSAAVLAPAVTRAAGQFTKLMDVVPLVEEPETTPNRIYAGNNRQAVTDYVNRLALAEYAKAAVVKPYESYEDASTTRDALTDRIDTFSLSATDDVFTAMQALRVEVVESVPPTDETLPRIATVRLPDTTPSLVLAYRLYDDASRNTEIVARNHVRHPGFIPSNRDLQVLTDV